MIDIVTRCERKTTWKIGPFSYWLVNMWGNDLVFSCKIEEDEFEWLVMEKCWERCTEDEKWLLFEELMELPDRLKFHGKSSAEVFVSWN